VRLNVVLLKPWHIVLKVKMALSKSYELKLLSFMKI